MRTLVELLREIEQAYDKRNEPEPIVYQNYEPSEVWDRMMFLRWGKHHKVALPELQRALYLAEAEAIREDLTWMEALHRVVNRAVRKNRRGWESYSGDWLLFVRDFERLKAE